MHCSPHCIYTINDPLVRISHYRQKVLGGPIAVQLNILPAENAAQYGFEILAFEGIPNHGYLFVSAPPKFPPAGEVCYFKGIPSWRFEQAFA